MRDLSVPIGEAARQSGFAPSAIRYYEDIGLIGTATRSASGRRHYCSADIAPLSFIRRARDFGLPIDQIRALLRAGEAPADACGPARAVVAHHLAEVRAKRAELRRLETELARMIQRCDTLCACGEGSECSIFDDIGRSDFTLPGERQNLVKFVFAESRSAASLPATGEEIT